MFENISTFETSGECKNFKGPIILRRFNRICKELYYKYMLLKNNFIPLENDFQWKFYRFRKVSYF